MENCSKEERNPEELVDIQGYTPQKTIGHSNVHTEGQQEQRPPDCTQPPKGTPWQAEVWTNHPRGIKRCYLSV